MHHHEKQKETTVGRSCWIKCAIVGVIAAGFGSAIALPHLNPSIAPANACSAVHSTQAAGQQPQQIDWINLKTDSKLVVSYNVVAKGKQTVSLLIKQKLDNRQYLSEVIETLRSTDMVYGSYSEQDYPHTYKDYNYSVYSEDISCVDKKYVIKSESRYDRYDNIIVTNTYNLAYDINDTDLIAKLYQKYCI